MHLTQAIQILRLQRQTGITFGIVFISLANCTVRKIEQCTLRSGPDDSCLYFTDALTHEPKQCRKRLIRQLCINNRWHKITI